MTDITPDHCLQLHTDNGCRLNLNIQLNINTDGDTPTPIDLPPAMTLLSERAEQFGFNAAVIDPQGRLVAAGTRRGNTNHLLARFDSDLAGAEIVRTVRQQDAAFTCLCNGNGGQLYAGGTLPGHQSYLACFDDTLELIHQIQLSGRPYLRLQTLRWFGNHLYVLCTAPYGMVLIKLSADLKPVHSQTFGRKPGRNSYPIQAADLTISPDGTLYVAGTTRDHTLYMARLDCHLRLERENVFDRVQRLSGLHVSDGKVHGLLVGYPFHQSFGVLDAELTQLEHYPIEGLPEGISDIRQLTVSPDGDLWLYAPSFPDDRHRAFIARLNARREVQQSWIISHSDSDILNITDCVAHADQLYWVGAHNMPPSGPFVFTSALLQNATAPWQVTAAADIRVSSYPRYLDTAHYQKISYSYSTVQLEPIDLRFERSRMPDDA